MKKRLKRGAALCLAGMLSLSTFSGLSLKTWAESKNLIANPDFAEADVSAWKAGAGEATISAETMEAPIYGDVVTCGKISGRTSAYDCFAQDITDRVRDGKEYEFSFYAKLSEDYQGAPADQRVLEFAPYVTVDGQTAYLGSYSPEIQGTASQTLEPGKWTKYEGTFKLNNGKAPEQVVIRLLEQGTNYGQGDCVKGEYYVTGVTLKEIEKEPVEIEDVPALRDAVTAEMGEDFIVGTSIDTADINDEYCMALVTKHFNAVTLGNALKPDALFGYSNNNVPGTEEVVFNGEKMVVPVLNYSRAEKLLNVISEWNEENPDKQIKVRGHVLVWHSQTPEWFFHEDYDASKDYVSKEEMNKRLEWYIATVLEHFTGEDSPYKGMFYGWDVVNEAVSDQGKKYRTDAENPNESLSQATHGSNSSWWHVYQSNEYIINAFRYANKYAPAELELYYNDYNEFNLHKKDGIVKLINDVKAAEGTRLDGFGMQGHYGLNSPDASLLTGYIIEYAKAAGSVQITEWDVSSSTNYDGTDATKADEYRRQALYYMRIYNNAVKMAMQEGYKVTGLTWWGVVDKYSWLQSSSNVGGGSNGKRKQCPLLFDDDYKAKPAYWAFVDPTMLSAKNNPTPEPTEEPKATEAPKPTEEPQLTKAPEVTETPKSTESPQVQKTEGKGKLVLPAVIAGVAAVAGVGLILLSGKKKGSKAEVVKTEEPTAEAQETQTKE
ncbi:MAG: endo-1,4-beta-xylanase [Lachnospiraceae bacterium]|nr:endo-1,4-beta-xylanase [Lachnospiraceae bacterium]